MEHALEHTCATCDATTPAVVRTRTPGHVYLWPFGGSAAEQRRAQDHAAREEAELILRCTPCPRCGEVSARTRQEHADALRSRERRRSELVPVSLAVGAATGVALGLPGLLDLARSCALLGLALAASVAAASATAALLAWPRRPPRYRRGDVTFDSSRDGARTTPLPAAFAAPWTPPSPVDVAPPWLARAALALAVMASGAAALSALAFAGTFASVYVLDAKRDGGEVHILVDGKDAGHLASVPAPGRRDVTFTRIRLRNTHAHHLELTNAHGEALGSYDLAAAGAGWVIAPAAAQHDLCVTEEERANHLLPRGDGAESVTVTSGDLTALSRSSYDGVFGPSGLLTPRWSLRAVSCRDLASGKSTPFAAADDAGSISRL